LANVSELKTGPGMAAIGIDMHRLIAELYPLCRSITGDGLRDTLRRIQREIPLTILEVPTGTQVFDWTVPKEWNIRDAYIKNSRGERLVDFRKSNLHVVNYSIPVRQRISLEQLKPHLFTLPDRPDWIPYRTSYYQETWGFCMPHQQFLELQDDDYEICIDSSLENGSLSYGELYLPGETTDEILFSCHVCHPSLCNDNLSGIAVATFLAKHLGSLPRRYSYRFLFIPGTIGAITWLSLHEHDAQNVRHGLVLAGLGDAGKLSYKRSRRGNAEIDRAVAHVLLHSHLDHQFLDFSPYGYDERQFCSPAFDLPVGRLSRSIHGQFPEYHTSADNLDFVKPSSLETSFSVCLDVISLLEQNRLYINLNPKCEPQLGRRGLYRAIGGLADGGKTEMATLWTLNLCDGSHSLLDIAERSGLPFGVILAAARLLQDHGLLREGLSSSAKPQERNL
jgi:aminopeptidase-like protein